MAAAAQVVPDTDPESTDLDEPESPSEPEPAQLEEKKELAPENTRRLVQGIAQRLARREEAAAEGKAPRQPASAARAARAPDPDEPEEIDSDEEREEKKAQAKKRREEKRKSSKASRRAQRKKLKLNHPELRTFREMTTAERKYLRRVRRIRNVWVMFQDRVSLLADPTDASAGEADAAYVTVPTFVAKMSIQQMKGMPLVFLLRFQCNDERLLQRGTPSDYDHIIPVTLPRVLYRYHCRTQQKDILESRSHAELKPDEEAVPRCADDHKDPPTHDVDWASLTVVKDDRYNLPGVAKLDKCDFCLQSFIPFAINRRHGPRDPGYIVSKLRRRLFGDRDPPSGDSRIQYYARVLNHPPANLKELDGLDDVLGVLLHPAGIERNIKEIMRRFELPINAVPTREQLNRQMDFLTRVYGSSVCPHHTGMFDDHWSQAAPKTAGECADIYREIVSDKNTLVKYFDIPE